MGVLMPSSLVETLDTLEDPRVERVKLHNLTDIPALSVLAVICGTDSFVAIALYYQTTHDAIRRYAPHHLILGDCYEANAAIAMADIEAALPFVDVLLFQDFREPVTHLNEWHRNTGKPVLLADAEVLVALFNNPGCVGFHLCGAHQRNNACRRGLLDELDRPDQENVELNRDADVKIRRWMAERY
ncbi:MAG: transposase family protein [Caldilineaceae bacterium SB0661_bin_34]|nr:transposase family protein [Caldilineaceae bacterium SB0661_bin_34]